MFFRNCTIYQFSTYFDEPDDLNELLAQRAFQSVAPGQFSTVGWSPPYEGSEQLLFGAEDEILLCLRKEERVIPPAVIAQKVKERCDSISKETGVPVGGRQRTQVKDEVLEEMARDAFLKSTYLFGYIDLRRQIIVIDTPVNTTADLFCNTLREALGSLAIAPLQANHEGHPEDLMTGWMRNPLELLPELLEISNECSMAEADGQKVTIRGADLSDAEWLELIDLGNKVKTLGLCFATRVGFTLNEELQFKKIKFLDLVQEDRAAFESDTQEMALTADFTILTAEIGVLYDYLVEELGISTPALPTK